jgi:predicted RNA-binding Zn-ribbon protein involved in translation (DUF1610 family)
MAIAEGVAALTSLRSLYEVARDVRNSTDPEKLRAAAAQMFELAISAREQTAALQEARNAAMAELAALKAIIEKAENFDEKAKGYTREFNASGAFIYREKGVAEAEGYAPYFCPNCFDHKDLSMLQPKEAPSGTFTTQLFGCPKCGTKIPLDTSE